MPAMDFPNSPINGQTTSDGRYYFDSSVGATGAWRSTPLPVGGLPAGSIIQWSSNTAPANWLICDGSAVSRETYSSLFAAIGTTYGAGNGTTTFNLPDLRGRVAVGRNSGTFGTLGATGGAETHNHGTSTLTAAVWAGFWKVRQASTWVATNSGGVTAPGASTSMSNSGASIEGNTDNGSSLPPYQVVNYIIKTSAGWTAGDSELATRIGALETAGATTNRSGLVPIVPSSVVLAAGSSSVSASGLITLTNATNVSLNGVFSSTYKHYRIIMELETASAVPGGSVRLRASGTDASGASDYAWMGYRAINWAGAAGLNGTLSGSSWGIWDTSSGATVAAMNMDIMRPADAVMTKMISSGYHSSNANGASYYSGHHKQATAYDGISYINTTAFNGTIQILGYR